MDQSVWIDGAKTRESFTQGPHFLHLIVSLSSNFLTFCD